MIDSGDARVAEAIAACARTWPDVQVDRAVVAERLGRLDASGLEDSRLAELCLVWACLTGDPAAQRAIDRAIRSEAQHAVTELRQPAWLVDDVHQELGQRLLVAGEGREPRLASYAGKAALGRWLGVSAMRTALNLIRRDRPEAPLDHSRDDVAAVLIPPELAIVRERYRAEVEAAIRAAFDALDNPRDRNLLRLYYLERVGLEQLGQMFGVHGSTVSRWLTALRKAIVEDTRGYLAEKLGPAGNFADIDSLIRAVHSELDLTLSRILGTK